MITKKKSIRKKLQLHSSCSWDGGTAVIGEIYEYFHGNFSYFVEDLTLRRDGCLSHSLGWSRQGRSLEGGRSEYMHACQPVGRQLHLHS
jgi:hypothetical protein